MAVGGGGGDLRQQRAVGRTWRSPQRRFAYAMAAASAGQAIGHGLQSGRRGLEFAFAVLALACLAWAMRLRRVRVTSDLQELRIGGRNDVVLPWAQVRQVRGDAGRWSTGAVVEMQDGREVVLPEGLDVARVRQWQHEAFMAREYPEQRRR